VTFLRCIELPEAMANWSLTSLQLRARPKPNESRRTGLAAALENPVVTAG